MSSWAADSASSVYDYREHHLGSALWNTATKGTVIFTSHVPIEFIHNEQAEACPEGGGVRGS